MVGGTGSSSAEPATPEQLAGLRDQLGAARRERLDLERSLGSRASVEIALETAERDRDAVSNPHLEQLRARGEDLATRLVDAWYGSDSIRAHMAMVRAAGLDLTHAPHAAAYDVAALEEAEHRRSIAADLDRGGVHGVPVPRPLEMPLDRHPQQSVIDRWLGRS